jgi:COP9 signalosome complex subunit 6
VLINVSDHHTRVKAQANGVAPRLLGGLLGTQVGRTVEITNSFELLTVGGGDSPRAIDLAFLEKKCEQYKKVFPQSDFIGWYSTGAALQDEDMAIHKSITPYNESPVYMMMNPLIAPNSKDLPVTLYESEMHVIDGAPSMIFVKASYTIETVEAERISVDQIARILPGAGGVASASQLTTHLTSMHSAIKMLSSRIDAITQYLERVCSGTAKPDHALLRQIASLTRQLPAVDTPNFHQNFLTEYNDAVLMVYLACMTKGTAGINELADKFNIAFDKHSRRKNLL